MSASIDDMTVIWLALLCLSWCTSPFYMHKIRCWIGKHTFPMYARKFISINPDADFDGDIGVTGYEAICFECGAVKREETLYDVRSLMSVDAEKNYTFVKEWFDEMPELKLTEELNK